MKRDPLDPAFADAATSQAEGQSAVSWGAVLAGATSALAASFVLVALGAGFGLKLGSPWPGTAGAGPADFTPTLGASLMVVQVLASALGGYLAGRLRTKWTHVHGHEVHFRDTAHGLLAWAVSTLAGVVLAASVLGPMTEAPAASAPPAPVMAAGAPDAGGRVEAALARGRADREARIAAQISLFMGIGLLLGAFTASVAGALGGMRRDEMHETYWSDPARAVRP